LNNLLVEGKTAKTTNYITAKAQKNNNRMSQNFRTPQDRTSSLVEKDSYWKERVDLLIYEKKKWIKERKEFH
jgi:hypothetical protein